MPFVKAANLRVQGAVQAEPEFDFDKAFAQFIEATRNVQGSEQEVKRTMSKIPVGYSDKDNDQAKFKIGQLVDFCTPNNGLWDGEILALKSYSADDRGNEVRAANSTRKSFIYVITTEQGNINVRERDVFDRNSR